MKLLLWIHEPIQTVKVTDTASWRKTPKAVWYRRPCDERKQTKKVFAGEPDIFSGAVSTSARPLGPTLSLRCSPAENDPQSSHNNTLTYVTHRNTPTQAHVKKR